MDFKYFPTLPLKEILQKWCDVLSTDQDIIDYCMAKYGKAPTVFVGLDVRDSPGEEDCPLIVVFPGDKNEGLKQANYQYNLSIGFVILQENFTTTGNVREYHGIYEVDDIAQLSLKAVVVASEDYPVSQATIRIDLTEHQPQYAGHMDLTIDIPVTMGAELSY